MERLREIVVVAEPPGQFRDAALQRLDAASL